MANNDADDCRTLVSRLGTKTDLAAGRCLVCTLRQQGCTTMAADHIPSGQPDFGTHSSLGLTRREVLAGGLALAAAASFTAVPGTGLAADFTSSEFPEGQGNMPRITTKDGTEIFYKDWGTGQPIVFHHGWPLSADDWDTQMLFFLKEGYRVIAHDRRGHGRSTQTVVGNEMDTYADDVAELVAHLDLHDAIHVGHSTGGGEVARYLGRHGTSRVAKAALIGAVPPIMVKSSANPEGAPIEVFDGIRSGVAANRAQFYIDITLPFYGYNREGAQVSEGIRRNWWRQGMMGGIKAQYDCIKAFSETNFTEDLKKIDVPCLIMHGDDDQIVPIVAAAPKSAELVKDPVLKIYPGLGHGICTTHADLVNADLLAFVRT